MSDEAIVWLSVGFLIGFIVVGFVRQTVVVQVRYSEHNKAVPDNNPNEANQMRDIQISGHISESQAMDYIFNAVRANPTYEPRTVAGFDIDFIEVASVNERLARVIAPNQARTVVAVAFVDDFDQ